VDTYCRNNFSRFLHSDARLRSELALSSAKVQAPRPARNEQSQPGG
jgi:hypothetical protein